ncbi:MAG TPA: HRDC domain-containing protein [Terrimicrobiaceae bacterium]
MISDPQDLADLVARVSHLSRVAIDTEADSLHSYFEKLCLIQISTEHENILVDPLAGFSLQPLYEMLAERRLVLHGADYDLRMLHRGGQFAATNIFDTMIAARLCGYQELGLAALVAKHFGVKLSKASQKANWALRPLSNQMIEYAINDTKYLLPLAEILEAELLRLNRWEWFSESCERMIASAGEPRERDETKAWRIAGTAALSPRAQSVLRVLWYWRDVEARAWDRPPFHVMSNEDIVRIAERAVVGHAFSTPRMSNRRRKSFEIILALALHIPEAEWPVPARSIRRRPTREQTERFEHLKGIRDKVAAELGLDSSIVAPRGALEAASLDPQTPLLMRWQRKLLNPNAPAQTVDAS